MALKATIFKAELQVSDLDRNHYGTHQLTIARHPSETDQRMMVRILCFALHSDDALQFTKGLCADAEPDLWRKNLSGEIEEWIDLGEPEEKRVRRACGLADKVYIYCYRNRSAKVWWEKTGAKLRELANLEVFEIANESAQFLESMAERSMKLNCMIQDGQIWFGNETDNHEIRLHRLK